MAQFLTNEKGTRTGVVLSVKEYERLQQAEKRLRALFDLQQDLKDALRELKATPAGEMPGAPVELLLKSGG